MRSNWILPALMTSALALSACGPSDSCGVPAKPVLLSAKNLSREQRANALGVPPERVPQEAVTESPAALQAYDDYVGRHNDAAQLSYCIDSEGSQYEGRNEQPGPCHHGDLQNGCGRRDPGRGAQIPQLRGRKQIALKIGKLA